MRGLAAAFRLGVLHAFAYRLEVLTALLSAFTIVVLNASLWGAAAAGKPEVHVIRIPRIDQDGMQHRPIRRG